jgi:hypothetical protein
LRRTTCKATAGNMGKNLLEPGWSDLCSHPSPIDSEPPRSMFGTKIRAWKTGLWMSTAWKKLRVAGGWRWATCIPFFAPRRGKKTESSILCVEHMNHQPPK